ncbi:alpha/beta fold hydrolase [Pseudomonas sp. TCU-HL1]|uniref:alpha/beta fold hydrolase n=1 Tax=Pseudomonas sp. TCU-HL1 TaxID=1856685 RepID=UPI00083E566A|nr:alpha/beta hydrolase [Pseudomonas sp. TCU-HL1]AOE86282.1 alpha/beta hydrolase [Pseudomonas sp. TCU-HL1]
MKKFLIAAVILLAAAAATLYFSPAALTASVRLVERQLAGLSERQVALGDLSIHYYEGGPAKGETIVMVHGFAANKDNWLRFARHFTQRYHVIALDLPGFGDSDRPAGSYDVGTQAERLESFIKTLELGKVHLVGNSMGGHIAGIFAARYPQQVRSLALIDNGGITAPNKSELFRLIESGQPNPLVVRSAEDFQRMLEFVFVEPPPLPHSVKAYLAEQSIANEAHYDEVFRQLRERYIPLEPELPRIEAPTLLLWGDRDRVLDVSSIEVMKPLLKKPSVVIMQNCGHAPMLERPEETARHYQAFLDASHD